MLTRCLPILLACASLLAGCSSSPPSTLTVEHDGYLITAHATRLAGSLLEIDVLVHELSVDLPPEQLLCSRLTMTTGAETRSGRVVDPETHLAWAREGLVERRAVNVAISSDDQGSHTTARLDFQIVRAGLDLRVPTLVLGVGT
jgi:hypothetical protein